LFRPEHGTWLGITQQGRLACLTNFREEEQNAQFIEGKRSRGAMVNAYLRIPQDTKARSGEIAKQLVEEGTAGVGGFSLIFGLLRKPSWKQDSGEEKKSHWDGLAIVSNRSATLDDVRWLCKAPGETHALSNSHYGDNTWPKVTSGEELVASVIKESAKKGEGEQELRTRLLDILSRDTLPRMKDGEEWNTYIGQLKNSIFVPSIGSDQQSATLGRNSPLPNGKPNVKAQVYHDSVTTGLYGTQKQTIIMVDWSGKVSYFERTLFDNDVNPVSNDEGDRIYQFQVPDWNE
jgi:uncharacterized protein with NRDE domain